MSNTAISQGTRGLSQLVQVVTALTVLVDTAPKTTAVSQYPKPTAPTATVSDDDDIRPHKNSSKLRKGQTFPQRLMQVLSDISLSEVISWLPHGRSFVILRPDIFTEQVMPKYFPPAHSRTSAKYPSFIRKLNRWGFRNVTKGPGTGVFHHPFFRIDEPNGCLHMVCQKKSTNRSSSRRKELPPRTVNRLACSADERSLTSLASSASSSPVTLTTTNVGAARSGTPPTAILYSSKTESTPISFISKDSTFVARTLQERDAAEVAKAAKAMLYDAYMKALGAGEQGQGRTSK